jgi:ADP-heptose:LPS heptosyltransferase
MKGIGFWDICCSQGSWGLKAIKLADHLLGGVIAFCLPGREGHNPRFRSGALRLLVIRPGGMGDAVFLLPVIRELKRLGHSVDVLGERRNQEVFTSQEGLDVRVFCYDIWSQFRDVFRQEYDVVVDTEQWHYLSAITAYFLHVPCKAGFSTRPWRTRLFDVRVPYDQDEYELTCFTRLFGFLGIGMELSLNGSFKAYLTEISRVKETVNGVYAVVALGGSIALRRFTSDQASGLCRSLLEKGIGVVLLGGRDAAALAEKVLTTVNDARVVNCVGRTSLKQSAALIAQAQRFIGHDSGLLHIASALGVPSVAIFGPGNRAKWGPRGPGDKVVHAGLACSPCTRFGYTLSICHGKPMCIREDVLLENIF